MRGSRCVCTFITMRLSVKSVKINRPIFIGNLGLFWVYFWAVYDANDAQRWNGDALHEELLNNYLSTLKKHAEQNHAHAIDLQMRVYLHDQK